MATAAKKPENRSQDTEALPVNTLAVREIATGLTSLEQRANAIEVRDQDGYRLACQIALDGRAYIKDVGFKLDPGINSAKEHLDFLRNEKAKYVDPAKRIVEIAAQKAEGWKAEERRKAQAEEERINEQRRIEAQHHADEERRVTEAQAKIDRERREKELAEARKAGE